ncbi:hypothetical protein LEP1GSC043_2585 [Leptospira weilii str. Ecochallenge]|uniref:Uncharacterized protein n=1 Tax=Leptospira weilii str. Ecochallenge TaxID=1049986 RepID=N1U689_9LEPT|nr:hypothetical protein LEP1GSC043_2585 [Leptospira weilii str. Ecochallenge]
MKNEFSIRFCFIEMDDLSGFVKLNHGIFDNSNIIAKKIIHHLLPFH